MSHLVISESCCSAPKNKVPYVYIRSFRTRKYDRVQQDSAFDFSHKVDCEQLIECNMYSYKQILMVMAHLNSAFHKANEDLVNTTAALQ
jgi:hypothetical protein